MEAGRELDALIAEKVMGLEYCNDRGTHLQGVPDKEDTYILLLHYSTQIADAWLVVEKLQEAIFSLEWEKGWKENAWHIYIRKHENNEQITAFADTAPLAICLAALETVK